jgi:hypothetical protein
VIVSYKPESGQNQTWTFNPRRVKVSQAERIETLAGATYDAWLNGVRMGNAKHRRVLLWVCQTIEHPMFRWDDTPDFYVDELTVEMERAEIADLLDQVGNLKGLSNEKRAEVTELLERQLAEMPEDSSPKAESPTTESATSAS